MTDLKPFYDSLIAKKAAVQGVINEINTAMEKGTPEGEAEALALQSKLESAMADEAQAQSFYDTLQAATKQATSPAMNFLPIEAQEIEDETPEKKVLSLGEFQAMPPRDRLAFAKAGGKIAS